MEQNDKEEEKYLIMSFPSWVHYPICPMVNREKKTEDGMPEVGFLLAADVMIKKAVVYHENFINLKELKAMGMGLSSIKKTEYKNFDEMIDNGWKVD